LAGAGASTTIKSGSTTRIKVDGTGIGFFNVTPVARPSAYTQTYSTTTRTFPAYTADDQSGAYTGAVGDGEAKLTDLNLLRAAYETLRAHSEAQGKLLNQIVDDLQSVGLFQ
jgi:hypothetical protein